MKSKKKQRKLDFEVSELRLKIATSHGKNIVLSNREIRLLRHVELTEEDKERLRGSYKVAKKLEKLEGKQRESEDDDSDNNELGTYYVVHMLLCDLFIFFTAVFGAGSGWDNTI